MANFHKTGQSLEDCYLVHALDNILLSIQILYLIVDFFSAWTRSREQIWQSWLTQLPKKKRHCFILIVTVNNLRWVQFPKHNLQIRDICFSSGSEQEYSEFWIHCRVTWIQTKSTFPDDGLFMRSRPFQCLYNKTGTNKHTACDQCSCNRILPYSKC